MSMTTCGLRRTRQEEPTAIFCHRPLSVLIKNKVFMPRKERTTQLLNKKIDGVLWCSLFENRVE